MRDARVGNEVCSETIVIRSNDEWKRVVRSLRFDGERYDARDLRVGDVTPNLRLVAVDGGAS